MKKPANYLNLYDCKNKNKTKQKPSHLSTSLQMLKNYNQPITYVVTDVKTVNQPITYVVTDVKNFNQPIT